MPAYQQLMKRDYTQGVGNSTHRNWAYRNPGIVLVFCLAGFGVIAAIVLAVQKSLRKRRARAEAAKVRGGA